MARLRHQRSAVADRLEKNARGSQARRRERVVQSAGFRRKKPSQEKHPASRTLKLLPKTEGPGISTGAFFGANALYTLVLSPILDAARRKLWSPHQESPPPSGFPASASPTPRPLFHGELVFFWGRAYLFHMPSTFDFCFPTNSTIVPPRPGLAARDKIRRL
jgi:hypothetical protein